MNSKTSALRTSKEAALALARVKLEASTIRMKLLNGRIDEEVRTVGRNLNREKKMKRILANSLVVLVMFVCAVSAFAQTPYAIKQDTLGESTAVYHQNNPAECTAQTVAFSQSSRYQSDVDKAAGTWSGDCLTLGFNLNKVEATASWPHLTYGGVSLLSKEATFSHDHFVSLAMLLPHDVFFPVVRENLILKFGQPTQRSSRTLQNKLGAKFESEILIWDNGVSQIMLQEFGSDLNTSMLSFVLSSYAAEQEKIRANRKPSSDM